MRRTRRFAVLPIMALACSPAAAAAEPGPAAFLVAANPAHVAPARPVLPDLRMPRGDYRVPPRPVQGGLIGALPLGRNLQIAVGRFAVPDIAMPREAADVRRRERRLAAVAFSLRF
jgi:hypothetical protein